MSAYHDPDGRLHYAGGVGTGFDDRQLVRLAKILRPVRPSPPAGMVVDGEAPDGAVRWLEPSLVVEVQFAGWSPGGRLRHAVFLGERDDKTASDVTRPVPNANDEGESETAKPVTGPATVVVRPRSSLRAKSEAKAAQPAAPFIVARAPRRETVEIEGVRLTHPLRELWPGVTKEALSRYWVAVADHALPGLARRPLALVRCPTGIDGEHFFQKHSTRGQPASLRSGASQGDPYLAIDDVSGLVACTQMSAIELHAWGATEHDADRPDQLVFDLDPGDGVSFLTVVRAALLLRDALARLKLASFCRTTGGKGLHVLVPLAPSASWDAARDFAKAFAKTIAAERPGEFVITMQKAKRQGRILIDWLRNGRGATAIGSFSPRARPGATVAAPLAWREVTARLDAGRFTIATMPARLSAQKRDPWDDFEASRARLPAFSVKGKR